jgi:hypothetical protein
MSPRVEGNHRPATSFNVRCMQRFTYISDDTCDDTTRDACNDLETQNLLARPSVTKGREIDTLCLISLSLKVQDLWFVNFRVHVYGIYPHVRFCKF